MVRVLRVIQSVFPLCWTCANTFLTRCIYLPYLYVVLETQNYGINGNDNCIQTVVW